VIRTPPLIVLFATLFVASVSAAEGLRLAVVNITVEQGIAEGTVRLLNELMLTELSESGAYRTVIGERDIVAMLQLEEERAKLTGCVDEACLAEIGGALGVDYMFASNVGRLGEKYVLNAKLLDVKRAIVAGRASEIVPAGDEEALIGAMRRVVARINGDALDAREGRPNVLAWALAGVAAACLASGAVSGGLALRDQDELDGMERFDPDLAEMEDRVYAEAVAADVLLAVGGATAVASLVLFLVGGDDDGKAAAVSAAPLLGKRSGGATVGWRF